MINKSILATFALFLSSLALPLSAAHHEAGKSTASASFKYVELNEIGDPAKVLEVKEGAARVLESGEVRVQVLAAPIHPSNLLQIAGNYLTDPTLPSTPGSEGIGRVLEISSDITHLTKGQLVLLGGLGTWRDQLIATANRLTPLPDLGEPSMAVLEQLSMATINPLTALLMLNNYADLNEGDWVVQSAANSAVGGYLIQLAKQRGINTVNVVRRDGLAEELTAKGANAVLIDGPDLAEQIAKATNGEPVSLAVDAVGGETYARMAESLGEGGTIVSYGLLSGKQPSLNVGLTIGKDIRARGFWLTKWFQVSDDAAKQAAFGQVVPLIASGALKADVDSRFSVAEIKQAVTRAAERGRNGKVLIVPGK